MNDPYTKALARIRHLAFRHNLPIAPEKTKVQTPEGRWIDPETRMQARQIFRQANAYARRIFAKADAKMIL